MGGELRQPRFCYEAPLRPRSARRDPAPLPALCPRPLPPHLIGAERWGRGLGGARRAGPAPPPAPRGMTRRAGGEAAL